MKSIVKYFLLFLLLLGTGRAHASHIYGADFYYTHIIGNSYVVTLVLYGDCSNTGSFSSLPNISPQVVVTKNGAVTHTLSLNIQAPANGVEVSPVCPAQLNNTACASPPGTLVGVKKFT